MQDIDTSAFERAAALLSRDEHLDDDDRSYEPLSSESATSRSAARRQGAAQPRMHASRRQVTTLATGPPSKRSNALSSPSSKPLPSLAELSQQPILDLPNRKMAAPRAGRRAVGAASQADSRKAAVSAIEAALPSLDEESARIVARARALLENDCTEPMSGAGLPSPSRAVRVPLAPRSRPARSAPATSDGIVVGGGAAAEAQLGVVPGRPIATTGDDDGGQAWESPRDDECAARSHHTVTAAAAMGAGANVDGVDSPTFDGHAVGGPRCCQAAGGSSTDGAALAGRRVREARLAEERARQAEREQTARRARAAKAEEERLAAFQLEVRRRAATRQREDKEASERAAAEASVQARERELKQQEQAERAEEVRRTIAQSIAHKRAEARRLEQQVEQTRQAEAEEAKVRSQADGAQLQAAALARVRSRRRQLAEQREQHELQSELDYLAANPIPRSEADRRARDERSAAAERLRERRRRDDSGGSPADVLVIEQGDSACSINEHCSDDGWLEPSAGDELPELPGFGGWGHAGQEYTHVGFVIRGEPPHLPPSQPGRAPRRADGRTCGRTNGNSAGADDTGRDRVSTHRCGGVVAGRHAVVGGDGSRGRQTARHMADDHSTGLAERALERNAVDRAPPPCAEPAQVLEIRSPARSSRPPRHRFGDAPPVEPAGLDELADTAPPPLPGPLQPRKQSSLQQVVPAPASLGAGAQVDGCVTDNPAKAPRRKPWQRPPVPLDRPL